MPRGVRGSGKFHAAPSGVARPAAPAAIQPASAPPSYDLEDRKPLGSVHVDDLSGDALKRYARRAGVSQRDVESLTEDRLRQNTKLTIANHFDLITE